MHSLAQRLTRLSVVHYSPLLLHLLCDLLKGSMSTQQQMVQGRGFVILGYLLQKVSLVMYTDVEKYSRDKVHRRKEMVLPTLSVSCIREQKY